MPQIPTKRQKNTPRSSVGPKKMAPRSTAERRKKTSRSSAESKSTVVWGKDVEAEDFVKVPRTVLRLARYDTSINLQPRHMMLLLSLASRKFQDKKIRAYWEELGDDLGVSKDTVRKWAYELEKRGVIKIIRHRGRDQKRRRVGVRNDRNEFDLSPFIARVEKAFRVRERDREERAKRSDV